MLFLFLNLDNFILNKLIYLNKLYYYFKFYFYSIFLKEFLFKKINIYVKNIFKNFF